MKPGSTVRPRRSTWTVTELASTRTSDVEPTATMRPSATAIASARGRATAIVRTLPLWRTISGAWRIMPHDPASVHHEAQVPETRDVRARVAVGGDQIGELVRLDGAQRIGHAEPLGGPDRRHAHSLERSHPRLDVELELTHCRARSFVGLRRHHVRAQG